MRFAGDGAEKSMMATWKISRRYLSIFPGILRTLRNERTKPYNLTSTQITGEVMPALLSETVIGKMVLMTGILTMHSETIFLDNNMQKKTLGTILKVVLTPLTYTWLLISGIFMFFGDVLLGVGEWMNEIVDELKW